MLKIFVLEDDYIQQGRLEQHLQAIFRERHLPSHSIEVFAQPDRLLASRTEKGSHVLYFLDIEIKDEPERGFEVAMEIRDQDPHAHIVFVTTHSEFMPITFRYKIAALDFIDKGLDEGKFGQSLATCVDYVLGHQKNNRTTETFLLETGQAQVQVDFADILYFETAPISHKIVLHTKYDRLEFYGKLSDVIKADSRLFQCHRSFVVNPAAIRRIDKSEHLIYFENGDVCDISRRFYRSLMDKMRSSQTDEGDLS
ncbi:LytTR family transcriptional regulator DNA-binding domain-containing protein [Streptococcus caprae]|uniref:Response regulator transcription factor n=1 Tax=Streptococcus caprae TaxID=1640501 RepID=A0ABV8CT92_9STRE